MGFFDSLAGGAPGGPAGMAISMGSGLLQGIAGMIQKGQANKRLKNLKDPGYVIPEEYSKNLGIAENMARVGMPSEQYNQAQTNIQRGTQTGLRQLSRLSNPFAAIQGLARGQQEAGLNLDVANANARRQNILSAMGARREMAGQKLAQQQYAQQSYMDEVNQANALKGAGTQNMLGGLNSIGQSALYSSLYGQKGEKKPGKLTIDLAQRPDKLDMPYVSRNPTVLNTSVMRYPFPTIGTPRR